MFLHDIEICYNYSLVVLWNSVDTVKYAFTDPFLAVESFGLIIHKSPIVYNQCYRLFKDLKYIEETFALLLDITSLNLWVHLLENFLFNLGDVWRNMEEAKINLGLGKFEAYGLNIGQIVGDLFFMNPMDDNVWTEDASVIIRTTGHSQKVPSTFYIDDVHVMSEKPDTKMLIENLFLPAEELELEVSPQVPVNKEEVKRKMRFMNKKPMLKEGEQDKPILERLSAIPKTMKERKAIHDLQAALLE